MQQMRIAHAPQAEESHPLSCTIPSVPQSVILSPSRVDGGIRCRRKHVLSEMLGIVPNDYSAPARDFGEVMHLGVGQFWRGDRAIAAAAEVLRNAAEWPLNTTHTLALAHRLLDVYASEARLMPYGDPSEWEIETLEERKLLKIGDYTLGFQIDRLLRNVRTGAMALVDLKTASRCDKRWEVKWPRSIQMRLYAECIARAYGAPPQWLIIEGLEKTKPGVHYIPLPDFSEEIRAEAVANFEQIAEHDARVLNACRDEAGVVDVDKLLSYGLTRTGTNEAECWSFNSPCEFLPLCDAEPSQRLALVSADFHHEVPKHLV